jgi:Flp pilus assembly pilin Flp
MPERLLKFLASERGAITVDWVVLTALIVGLCGLVIYALSDSVGGLGSSLGEFLSSKTVE